MSVFKAETDLAAGVVAWLENFDVYQEVQSSIGSVADIVVEVDGWPWVIECKTSFGLSVLEQAAKWKLHGVPWVSVAVPSSRRGGRFFAEQVAQWQGIGVIEIDRHRSVNERIEPRFDRPRKRLGKWWNLLDECCDEQKTFCPAGSQNGRFTPFKLTVMNLVAVVKESPGITMKAAIDKIKSHHYRSNKAACTNLLQWLRTGVINEIEARQEGRSIRLYLAEKGGPNAKA